MAQLRQDYAQFTARAAEILVVNPDQPGAVAAYAASQGLPFPMLADPAHQVADRYGQQVKWLKLGRLPALLVLDRDGVVRHTHYADSMTDLPKNSDILAVLDGLHRT